MIKLITHSVRKAGWKRPMCMWYKSNQCELDSKNAKSAHYSFIWWYKLADWCSQWMSLHIRILPMDVDFHSFRCNFTSFRFATCIYQFQKWEMRLQMKTDRMARLRQNWSVYRMKNKKLWKCIHTVNYTCARTHTYILIRCSSSFGPTKWSE